MSVRDANDVIQEFMDYRGWTERTALALVCHFVTSIGQGNELAEYLKATSDMEDQFADDELGEPEEDDEDDEDFLDDIELDEDDDEDE